MDVITLTAFLSPFLPFLIKLGEKSAESAASKFGEDAWNKAKKVWRQLQPNVEAKQDAKVAAEQVAAKPESEARKAVFQEELETLLKEQPDLAKAIAQILNEDAPDGTSGTQIIQNVTGNQNQVIGQVFGGKVFGNVQGGVNLTE
jgi:transketolase